jgi:hypothetical protein
MEVEKIIGKIVSENGNLIFNLPGYLLSFSRSIGFNIEEKLNLDIIKGLLGRKTVAIKKSITFSIHVKIQE